MNWKKSTLPLSLSWALLAGCSPPQRPPEPPVVVQCQKPVVDALLLKQAQRQAIEALEQCLVAENLETCLRERFPRS